MQIIVRHKKKDSWSGVVKYKSCFDYITPALTRSGNRHTGLTDEDAKRLEKELGLGENTLAPYSAYWKTFTVKISDRELMLDTDRPWEELQYIFLKNHHRVSNGPNDMKPRADYILIDKDSEAVETNKINKRKREAFREFDKMSIDEMRKALRIFGMKSDTASNEVIESKLAEIVEKDPNTFFTKWVNNNTKNTEFMIQSAIAKNIMRKNKNAYYYGTDIIGTSLEDAIAYLDNKNNQDLKVTVLNELENK